MADIPTPIRRVELRVSDVEASAEFYSRLTGLEASELSLEEARLRVPDSAEPILILSRARRPGPAPLRAAGLFHTAFRYPDRAGVADALKRAVGLGIPLSGASDHGVSEALYLDDPDGLGIELYRDRPRSEWPKPGPKESVRMFSEPLDMVGLGAAASSRSLEDAAVGLDIGHVHLRVADTAAAIEFWTGEPGMKLMTEFGPDAAFLARDGYHHHIGANQWLSRGADREPEDGPGLELVVLAADGGAVDLRTPDGVRVTLSGG